MTLTLVAASVAAALTPRAAPAIFSEVPVDPDSEEATRLLIEELSKAPYQAAKPTLFDRASKAFSDWLASLTIGDGNGIPTIVSIVLLALVAVAIIAAIIVYGVPRLNRKSQHHDILFGEADYRTAAQLREAAEQAATREDYAAAIADMFRSIARGLSERTLVNMTPGTTGHGFATRASRVLPELATELVASADTFDRVRYMRKPATREEYEQLRALESRARSAKPDLAEATL